MQMNQEQRATEFAVFCIENTATRLQCTGFEVFRNYSERTVSKDSCSQAILFFILKARNTLWMKSWNTSADTIPLL